ncbi:hypothetical protein KKA09_00860 [Patescibacteria group bacterium]|nr:hypothetical protein [Patescibacteria group bacterium]
MTKQTKIILGILIGLILSILALMTYFLTLLKEKKLFEELKEQEKLQQYHVDGLPKWTERTETKEGMSNTSTSPYNTAENFMTKIFSSYSGSEIVVSMNFPAPTITKVKILGLREFDRIGIEGLPNMSKAGEPLLPLKGIEVLLPYNKDISEIEVSYPKERVLEGTYTIEPAQSGYPIGLGGKSNPPKKEVYDQETYIPQKLFSEKSTQMFRGYKILPLNLYPVRYIPKFGKLYFYPQISIKILFKPKLFIESYSSYRGLLEDEEKVKKEVINPEVIKTYPNPSKSSL